MSSTFQHEPVAREITQELAELLTFNKLLAHTYYALAWHARMSRIACVDNKITHEAC